MTITISGTTGVSLVQDATVTPAKLTTTGGGFTLPCTAGNGVVLDSSGRVTTPYQPCFQAYATGGYITTSQVIPFSNTRTNVGSNFSTSTYRFTAPVAGSYYFIVQGFIDGQNTWGNLQIRVNGSYYCYSETSAPYTQSLVNGMVIYLNASDYVDTYWNTSAGKGLYKGSTETSFSGFLVG